MADANEQRAKMIANLPNATGKALGEWVTLIAASGLDKHGAIVKLLKGEHGVTHGYANLITHEFRSGGKTASSDDLVASQYAGAKALPGVMAIEVTGNTNNDLLFVARILLVMIPSLVGPAPWVWGLRARAASGD